MLHDVAYGYQLIGLLVIAVCFIRIVATITTAHVLHSGRTYEETINKEYDL
jgi:hypothetical protein